MDNQSTNINELLDSNDESLVQEIINEMKQQQKDNQKNTTDLQKQFQSKMEAVPQSVKQTSMNHHPFLQNNSSKKSNSDSNTLNFSSITNIRFIKEFTFIILLTYFLNTNIVNKLLLKIPQFVSSDNLNIPNFIGILVKSLIAGVLFILLKLVI